MSDGVKYPWQQFVVDAYVASPECLPSKINIAHRAIAARLIDRAEPDAEERLALNDALRALSILVDDTRRPERKEEPQEDIA